MSDRRLRLLEAGLFLVVVAGPLVFSPLFRSSFADPKLAVLVAGAILLWAARPRVDRRLAIAAGVWVGALAVAAAAGVDPLTSLLGHTNVDNGLVLLGASAFLLVAGTGIPNGLAARLPTWLVATGVVVTAVLLAGRFASGAVQHVLPGFDPYGSTFGNQAFVSAFVAVALVALLGMPRLRIPALMLLVVVLGTGLAVAGERTGWVAAAVGIPVAALRLRVPRARALALGATLVVVLAAWTAANSLVAPAAPLSPAARFAQVTSGLARARLIVWKDVGRAFLHRPLLGWGPADTVSAFASEASASDVRAAGGFLWLDAHDLVMESATTSGAVGLACLAALALLAFARIRRGDRAAGWAAGAAAALAAHHLVQPVNVTDTPLMFLLAGIAARPPTPGAVGAPADGEAALAVRGAGLRRAAFAVTGALLAAGLVLSGLSLASSAFEAYGVKYGSEPALRTAIRLVPWRVTPPTLLAYQLAIDATSDRPAAAREARSIARGLVASHPWDPTVRLAAADVELLLNDPRGAAWWAGRQRAIFPGTVPPNGAGRPEVGAPAGPAG